GIRKLSQGLITRAEFLERFGHRSTNEMELSQPRWSEDSVAVDGLMSSQAGHNLPRVCDPESICAEAKLAGPARDQFLRQAARLRTYLGLREAAKHYLLMGYAVIRRALVELDRRFHLNGGIFFLTPSDF